MSKINRFDGDVPLFAQDATENYLFNFGDDSKDSWDGELSTMMNDSFKTGWETVSPSSFPPKQWFNSAMRAISQSTAYLYQMGIPEYNAEQQYFVGSKCQLDGVTYTSLADDNVGNDPFDGSDFWENKEKTTAIKSILEVLIGFRFRDSLAGFDRTAIALKADGTEILRADFPKLWSMAEPIAINQALINANPEQYAANYGTGDGETTFTLPNYGLMPWDAAAGMYGNAGTTVEDAIRNITAGGVQIIYGGGTPVGAFSLLRQSDGINLGGNSNSYGELTFNASLAVPTADINRPKTNFSDVWIIHGEIA